jgi:hypothetical protein
MPNLSNEHIARLKHGTPNLNREDAYRFIPIAFGDVIMTASPKEVTISNLLATDRVIASIEKDDNSGAGAITANVTAGKITFTSSVVTTGDGIINYVVYR